MPNLPYVTRLERLQAQAAYLERELAEGRGCRGMQGQLRQLRRRLTWYAARSERVPGGARVYRLPQGRGPRVPATPPDLVLDVQALLRA